MYVCYVYIGMSDNPKQLPKAAKQVIKLTLHTLIKLLIEIMAIITTWTILLLML